MTEVAGSAGAGSPNGAGAAGAGAAGAAGAASGAGASGGGAPDIFTSLPADLQANPAVAAYKKETGFDVAGLVKEHVNLQGLIGKKGVIAPAETDPPEAWERYYNSLGRPEKPDGYQFQKPEGFQGYSDEFAGSFRTEAHKHGLTTKQAAAMHDWFVKAAIDGEQVAGVKALEDGKTLDTTLRTKWGAAYDAKVAAGRKAAKAFAPPEVIDQLEKSLGSAAAVTELFANIGEKMGEDGLVGSGGTSFAVTPEQAKAELAKLDAQMNDQKGPAMDKFHPEHKAWMDRRTQLFAAAYPG